VTVIELGEVAAAADDEPPDRPGSRRPLLSRRQVREAGLALIAVLCLLAVTGSARPQQHGIRLLWSVAAAEPDGVIITRHAAYLQHAEADNTRLTAYDLATGAVRWTRQLTGTISFAQVAEKAGVLLAPTDPPVISGPDDQDTAGLPASRETVALNADTGAELWRTPGEPQLVNDDTALMIEQTDDGRFLRMRLIRLGDNRTLWSRETPGVQNQTVAMADDQPTRVITASGAGDIKIFGYADGAYLTGARIPWVKPRPQDGFFNDISANADYLVVNRTIQDTFDTNVYRLDTLAEAWSIQNTNGYAFTCGRALCLNSGSAISAHDLATGRRLWQVGSPGNVWPATNNRLVLDDGTEEGNPLLVDAGSGRPVGEPGRGSTVWDVEASDEILLLHTTTSPPDRTSVTRWDLSTGHQHLLGSIDEVAIGRCQSAGDYLACQRGGTMDVLELAR
jgi:outer membrane protein assembly factor BamB